MNKDIPDRKLLVSESSLFLRTHRRWKEGSRTKDDFAQLDRCVKTVSVKKQAQKEMGLDFFPLINIIQLQHTYPEAQQSQLYCSIHFHKLNTPIY